MNCCSSSKKIQTEYIYDEFGRIVNTRSNSLRHQSIGSRLTSNLFAPTGESLKSTHTVIYGGDTYRTIAYNFHDQVGRLISEQHYLQYNNQVGKTTTAEYDYTAKNQIKTEYLGGKNGSLQQVDYSYYASGILSEINDFSAPLEDLYAVFLDYSNTSEHSNSTKSNGNITSLRHYSPGSGKYTQDFEYDGLNRLKVNLTIVAGKDYGSDYDYDARGNFETLGRTGMISNNNYGPIDQLTYFPTEGSNRVDYIEEVKNSSYRPGFDEAASKQQYKYDRVGNVTRDPNNKLDIKYNYLNLPYQITKDDGTITQITYSADGLKLSERTTSPSMGSSKTRSYLGDMNFDGDDLAFVSHSKGRVLPKQVASDQRSPTNCGDVIISDIDQTDDTEQTMGVELTELRAEMAAHGTIAQIEFLTPDGTIFEGGKTMTTAIVPTSGSYALTGQRMVELKSGFSSAYGTQVMAIPRKCAVVLNWQYEYSLTDHLGNVRIRFSDLDGDRQIDKDSEILSEHHYYPYGMEMVGTWSAGDDNRYRYNGIERNEELGLDLAPFRSYDPAIGRWLQLDPMAELAEGWTPYRFGFNNPIRHNDPLGLFERDIKGVPGEETERELKGREIRIGYTESSQSSNSSRSDPPPDFSWLIGGGGDKRCYNCSESSAVPFTDETLAGSIKAYWGSKPDHILSIERATEDNLPDGYSIDENGYLLKPDGGISGGVTLPSEESGSTNSRIYISKLAFRSKSQLALNVGHEIFHGNLFKAGVHDPRRHHAVIFEWQKAAGQIVGYSNFYEGSAYPKYLVSDDFKYAPQIIHGL